MPIPANYFIPDPDRGGASQADADVQNGRRLLTIFARIVADIETGTTRSGEALTPAQKLSIRNKYDAWRAEVQVWFNALPIP